MRNFSYGVTDALAANFRVILVDRPGSGHSTPIGDQPGILTQAAIVAAFIDQLGLHRPLLVGHSLAGAIGLGVATHHPDAIGDLALLAPMTQPPHSLPTPVAGAIKGAGVGRTLFANLLGTPLSRATYELRWHSIFAPDPVPDDFAIRGGGALGDRSVSVNAALVEQASADADLNLDVEDMDELIASGGGGCVTDQILYNLTRRAPELDLLPWREQLAMPAMAYSPVEQGRLIRHAGLSAIAADFGATTAQLALAWTLRRGSVIAIPKAGTIDYVLDNRAALDLVLDDAILARLDAEFPCPRTPRPLEML